MKLIKAHIENFGKISQQDFNFNDGLTTFCQNNGYGKTTLATFIKVMFYGMATTSKSVSEKGKDLKDREHYYPFNGGKYGGYLVYENLGKTYKIVRYFDKKSQPLDDCKLYENDSIVDLPDSLGKTLFEVDEASFSKILYFNEDVNMNFNSPDITFKLTGLVQGTTDEEYVKVKKTIDDARKKLKVQGGRGEIQDLKTELLSINNEIENLKTINDSLSDKYKTRNELLNKLKEAEKKLKEVSEIKVKNDNYKTYERYFQEVVDLKREVESIKSKYPLGVFDENELLTVYSNIDGLISLEQEKRVLSVSEDKLNEFNSLNQTFQVGVPTTNDIDNLIEDINSVNDLKNKPQSQKIYNLLFVIGCILLMLGGGLCVINVILGVLLICLGAVNLTFGFLNYKQVKKGLTNNELLLKTQKVKSYLSKYNVNVTNLLEGAYELKNKINAYNSLFKEISSINEKLQVVNEKYLELSSQVKNIFNKYQIVPSSLNTIKLQLRGIETDIITLKNKTALYNQSLIKAENYKKEKNLVGAPCYDVSYQEVELEVKSIQSLISNVDREIKNDEDRIENLNDKIGKKDELKTLYEQKAKRYDTLLLVSKYLERAEKSLKDKYITPVKDKFLYYADKLEKVLGEKIILKNDFQILFERGGELKSHEFLSAGQLVLCNLCLRLALIDNMFKNQKPFVVLDDYFVFLDKDHMSSAKNLLKELSNDRQIIYFTCHDSRII